jgi:hypothetical protein
LHPARSHSLCLDAQSYRPAYAVSNPSSFASSPSANEKNPS